MKSSDIALFLNCKIYGSDFNITSYATLSDIKDSSVIFVKKYSEEYLNILNTCPKKFVAIVVPEYEGKIKCTYIVSQDPRLSFIRVLNKFYSKDHSHTGIHVTAIISESAIIGEGVYVGANCFIGDNVVIGDRTKIFPNTVIMDDTIIGSDCYVKSGVVIGQPGFGFENDEKGIPIHFPHLGKVIIGNNVYIGANTTIDRAALEDTFLADNVKVDNLVHIAHNVHIEENSLIIAHAMLGGGVHIGKNCWISPNVAIKQQIKVGDKALVGLGAVVIRDVDANTVIIGNPGKTLIKK